MIRPPTPATTGANHGRLVTRRTGLSGVGVRLGVEVGLGASMSSDSVMVSSVRHALLKYQGLSWPYQRCYAMLKPS